MKFVQEWNSLLSIFREEVSFQRSSRRASFNGSYSSFALFKEILFMQMAALTKNH